MSKTPLLSLRKSNPWQYAILEPDSQQYFLTNDQKDGLEKAQKRYPNKVFYVFPVEQFEGLLDDAEYKQYRRYFNRLPITKRKEVIEENDGYNERESPSNTESLKVALTTLAFDSTSKLQKIKNRKVYKVLSGSCSRLEKIVSETNGVLSKVGKVIKRHTKGFLFGSLMLGMLALAPKARGDADFEGQLKPNNGTYPDSVFFIKLLVDTRI